MVSDGAEAVVKLARMPFDLLLTDVLMPNMDGVELSLKVARDFPDLPVLMMSGNAPPRRRANDIASLAPILMKPFTMVDLNAAVEQALAQQPAD